MQSIPDVHGVRLATLHDLPRIAIVAAAAFFWSPSFRFQRPRYKDFPADTLASYWNEYHKAIRDPACVVLVAEDVLDPDEAERVYDALQPACRSSFQGPRGIVGVCSFTLKKNSCFAPLLQPAGESVSDTRLYLGLIANVCPDHGIPGNRPQIDHEARDQCTEALRVYETVTGPPKTRYVH